MTKRRRRSARAWKLPAAVAPTRGVRQGRRPRVSVTLHEDARGERRRPVGFFLTGRGITPVSLENRKHIR